MAKTNAIGVRDFLRVKAAAGYPLHEIDQYLTETGETIEIFARLPFVSFDSFDTSADNRVISGKQRVLKNGKLLWKMVYHQVVTDPSVDAEELYEVLGDQFWADPDPDFPIGGRPQAEFEGYTYKQDSVFGPRELGHFALEESITKGGSRIYVAHKTGGWVKSEAR